MKRSDMVCEKCDRFEDGFCRLEPIPKRLEAPLYRFCPDKHWCAQGEWRQWSERYGEWERFGWGGWDEEE